MMENILFVLAAYLIGAVPFGYLVGKWHGIDLREHGSKNIGATNVGRVLGKKWGLIVFFLDFLKGFIPVYLFRQMLGGSVEEMDYASACWFISCIFAVVLGHTFTCFLHFKGGKGVATSAGALFAISWMIGGGALLAWIVVMLLTHYVSLASMVAAVVMIVVALYDLDYMSDFSMRPSALIVLVLVLLAALVIWKHRSNIVRLMNGTESKSLTRKKDSSRS